MEVVVVVYTTQSVDTSIILAFIGITKPSAYLPIKLYLVVFNTTWYLYIYRGYGEVQELD